ASESPYTKDAFHAAVIDGVDRTCPDGHGTKVAAWSAHLVEPGEPLVLRLRLRSLAEGPKESFGPGFDAVVDRRRAESDAFWSRQIPARATAAEQNVLRQAWAGLLWSKQFYHYVPREWLEGDPSQPPPPEERREGRNVDWARHLYNRDVISVPDKW